MLNVLAHSWPKNRGANRSVPRFPPVFSRGTPSRLSGICRIAPSLVLGERRRASFLGLPIAWLGAGWRALVDVTLVGWMRARERLGGECRQAASGSLLWVVAVVAPKMAVVAATQAATTMAVAAIQTT